MTTPLIKIEGLSFQYPSRTDFALEHVDLKINEGEFVAIIGQNGSGKTTLIKHFNGLLKPTDGKVYIRGVETTEQNTAELAKSIGYVFQNPDHQIFAETVRDEVAFGPKNLGFEEERIEKEITRVLKEMDLDVPLDEMPFQLSRGQRQRLAVASVLAMEPSLLIIDEPTTGQDWKESILLMQLVQGLNDKGHTCIVTTHNMNLVSLFARRVIVMKSGNVFMDGTTQDIFCREEELLTAGIKAPDVYLLARKIAPQIELDKPLTPEDLAGFLLEKPSLEGSV
ncbi:energy-coupling factor ABC transporter ATP-binding protein [bacterium]|nr:energy-coupling factor ABC transporter ATP-binding protein [bacterium]